MKDTIITPKADYKGVVVAPFNSHEEMRLANSNSKITEDELIELLRRGEEIYSYFQVNTTIIMDRVTENNLELVGKFIFGMYTDSDHSNHVVILNNRTSNSELDTWLSVEKLADDYNLRNGIYKDKLLVNDSDTSDYPDHVFHIDNNNYNNNPTNINRVSSTVLHDSIEGCLSCTEKFIGMDYYRDIASSSKHRIARKYGALLYVAIMINKRYGVFVSEFVYNLHKYEFSARPPRWSRLVEVFGEERGVMDAIEAFNDKSYFDFKCPPKNKIRVYLASGFFCDDDRSLVSFMESFLERRGYELYSPSRDGIMLTPDASQEDRLRVFQENVDNVFKCDLLMVMVNNKDTGTSTELGMKVGQWKEIRDSIIQMSFDDPSVLTDKDKAILNQECPRIITFADNGTNLNVMLLGAVLKHCTSWDDLEEYLNYIDDVGIDNAVRDKDSITDVKVY